MTLNIFDIVWFSFLWNFNTRKKNKCEYAKCKCITDHLPQILSRCPLQKSYPHTFEC